MLTKAGCLLRQERWRGWMEQQRIGVTAFSDYRDIYYFTGVYIPFHLAGTVTPLLLLLFADGRSILFIDSASAVGGFDAVVPESAGYGVSEIVTYSWAEGSTTNPNNTMRLYDKVEARLQGMTPVERVGWQFEATPYMIGNCLSSAFRPDDLYGVDTPLELMQRRKDPDEIACIRESIRIGIAAYDAAKAAIAPGVSELDVLSAARAAAFRAAGEIVYVHGDFRAGEPGGYARSRVLEAGELYNIDLWVYHHGYWSDMCRTFAVGGEPTTFQRGLHAHMMAIHTDVAQILRPGIDGKEVWRIVDQRVRQNPAMRAIGLIHHAGHGLGLRAHEQPDLNPERGGVLEPGCVMTLEPGGYPLEARGGVRLENVYLITATGVELLSPYPYSL